MVAFVIEDELKKLPDAPGVYLMYDNKEEIIYVGKAISLKNRVRQYFQSSRNKSLTIQQMISHIDRFEYTITDSELEALILENNLIKEHRPRYNTLLKDDKTYPYIKVTVKEDYPRIMMSRSLKKDKAKYYGPFSSAAAVKDTLDFLCKAYKIRTCNRVLPRDIGLQRPCLDYHIHQCDAPCFGYISKEEYNTKVKSALDFLNGHIDELIEEIRCKMEAYSEELNFEEAARYRDLLNSLLHVSQRQKISSDSVDDRDIIALARDEDHSLVQLFFIREGKLIGREHHYIQAGRGDTKEDIVESFIKQFYSGTPFLPKEIHLQYEIPDAKLIEKWLSDKRRTKVKLVVPKKGDKEKLIELAYKNAKMVLDKDREKFIKEKARTSGALKELGKLLGLDDVSRIEAYDIFNTSGIESVGSMVVFQDAKPKKNAYRKFKIRTVSGPDDYASMREVIYRRFTHNNIHRDDRFAELPSLLLIDGGRGQVNMALSVLEELGLDIAVCGMVKDDKHRTRGLYFNNQELSVDIRGEAFHLISRIQEDAHRFAIEYHRSLRSKTQVKSVLDDIKGIGTVRRRALMRHFKSIEAIKEARIEDLQEVDSMDKKSAEAVYGFFHKSDNLSGEAGDMF